MKVKMTHHQTRTVTPSSVPAYPGDISPGPWGKAGDYEGKQSRKNTLKMMKMKSLRKIQAESLVSISNLGYFKYSVLERGRMAVWVSVMTDTSLFACFGQVRWHLCCKAVCYLFCCQYFLGNWYWALGSWHFYVIMYLNKCLFYDSGSRSLATSVPLLFGTWLLERGWRQKCASS